MLAPVVHNREAELPEAVRTITDTITMLLQRRGAEGLEVTPEARISDDLGLDSLELAELSAALEDELGSDPYSEGVIPVTVGELIGFYES